MSISIRIKSLSKIQMYILFGFYDYLVCNHETGLTNFDLSFISVPARAFETGQSFFAV